MELEIQKLLCETLRICRAKSHVEVNEWHRLKNGIEACLDGEEIKWAGMMPQTLTVFTGSNKEALEKLEVENRKLKFNASKNRELIAVYRKREANISRVLKAKV